MKKSISMKRELLSVENAQYPLKIHYEKRHNSTVSVRQTGIHIRLPYYLPRLEKDKIIRELKNWAIEKILKNRKKFTNPWREYKDGQQLQVGDISYCLKMQFKDKKSSSAKLKGSTIYLILSANLSEFEKKKMISTLLSRVVGNQRLPALEKKIQYLNDKFFKKKIKKIFFKNNKSNWGSCSKEGNINITTRLLLAPEDVLEYVCIHELAHLAQLNHSSKFWALVKKAMPDYREKEKWLKNNGNSCFF